MRKKLKPSSCGRHIASVPFKEGEHVNEIDPLATCLAAALRRATGTSSDADNIITEQDLRRRLRVQPVRKTILFLIDSSESMLVEEQMKLAKGAVLGLLTKAYQKRYRVGVVVFRDSRAEVALPPTTSIARARRALQAVATGGGTPLADGLHTVLRLIKSERIRHPDDVTQMILVTDGRPSVSMQQGADLREEVLTIAARFPARNIPSIILVTEEAGELIREIAAKLNAPVRKITDVILDSN